MGVPLREEILLEKELRNDNKNYYIKRKFYFNKEGLLWKNIYEGKAVLL